jgi:hypothetical protein
MKGLALTKRIHNKDKLSAFSETSCKNWNHGGKWHTVTKRVLGDIALSRVVISFKYLIKRDNQQYKYCTACYYGVKSGSMRWAGHVVCKRKKRWAYGVSVGKPEGRNPLEHLGVDGNIVLKWA